MKVLLLSITVYGINDLWGAPLRRPEHDEMELRSHKPHQNAHTCDANATECDNCGTTDPSSDSTCCLLAGAVEVFACMSCAEVFGEHCTNFYPDCVGGCEECDASYVLVSSEGGAYCMSELNVTAAIAASTTTEAPTTTTTTTTPASTTTTTPANTTTTSTTTTTVAAASITPVVDCAETHNLGDRCVGQDGQRVNCSSTPTTQCAVKGGGLGMCSEGNLCIPVDCRGTEALDNTCVDETGDDGQCSSVPASQCAIAGGTLGWCAMGSCVAVDCKESGLSENCISEDGASGNCMKNPNSLCVVQGGTLGTCAEDTCAERVSTANHGDPGGSGSAAEAGGTSLTMIIVIIAVVFLVLFVIVAGVVYFCCWKRRTKEETEEWNEADEADDSDSASSDELL